MRARRFIGIWSHGQFLQVRRGRNSRLTAQTDFSPKPCVIPALSQNDARNHCDVPKPDGFRIALCTSTGQDRHRLSVCHRVISYQGASPAHGPLWEQYDEDRHFRLRFPCGFPRILQSVLWISSPVALALSSDVSKGARKQSSFYNPLRSMPSACAFKDVDVSFSRSVTEGTFSLSLPCDGALWF